MAKLAEFYGKKLGRGVILVEKKQAKKAENIFKETKASYQKQEIFS